MQVTNNVGVYFRTGQMPVQQKYGKTAEEIATEALESEYEKAKNEVTIQDLLAMMEKAKSKEVTSIAETDWRDMTAEQWDNLDAEKSSARGCPKCFSRNEGTSCK